MLINLLNAVDLGLLGRYSISLFLRHLSAYLLIIITSTYVVSPACQPSPHVEDTSIEWVQLISALNYTCGGEKAI